jgi:hypothetical protein
MNKILACSLALLLLLTWSGGVHAKKRTYRRIIVNGEFWQKLSVHGKRLTKET